MNEVKQNQRTGRSKLLSRRHLTPKKTFLFVYDMGVTFLAALFSLLVIYEGRIPTAMWQNLKLSWYFMIILSAVVFYFAGFYWQMWAFARGAQYAILIVGTTVQLFFTVLFMQLFKINFSLPTYVLYWFLLNVAVFAIRVLYRLYRSHMTRVHSSEGVEKVIRVMIVGAGEAGTQLITEMKTAQKERVVLCAVDDNELTHRYENNGVPVLGDRHDIPKLAIQYRIDEIIIAIPSASSETIRAIVDICRKTQCRISVLPFFSTINEHKMLLSDVRDIRIEDLLQRESVDLNTEQISGYLRDKVVFVSGAGGSIGSELARQIASFEPLMLILFDIYENNVYELQQELLVKYGKDLNLETLIGSVRDSKRIDDIFYAWKPDVVFHAAAHKHVPLMEDSPCEAVKNNVFGTYNVAKTAAEHGVKKFVLISTDKAVCPTNVMGSSKRLCEIVLLALDQVYPDTDFAAVRFGNVLGSNGSVIPLFMRQIKEQGEVTVTHPEVTRFFMTIPEASGLVLQAGAFATHGTIFVLDMNKPVKIVDLAYDLIRLAGFVPEKDIPVRFIGLRPGEKLHEELYLRDEEITQTDHSKIFSLKQINNVRYLKAEVYKLCDIINCEQINLVKFMLDILRVVETAQDNMDSAAIEFLPFVPQAD